MAAAMSAVKFRPRTPMEASMRRFVLSACAAALGATACAATAAAQEVLASGAMEGGPGQARIVCYFTNVSAATVSISAFQILSNAGAQLPLVINQCGAGALAGGRSCGIAADVPQDASFACRVRAADGSLLRGVIESRTASGAVLNAQVLQ